MKLEQLLSDAQRNGIRIVTRDDGRDYDAARQVHNVRLQNRPECIAYCASAANVSWVLRKLGKLDYFFTVRSGGHHHEGMCVGEGKRAVVIDVSEINAPDIATDLSHAWLGSGQKLGDVIDWLADHDRMIPTGVCATVNVGGLTQGGGWGISYRMLGATIDKLIEVEMVLSNGDIIQFNECAITAGETSLDIDPERLFWAIRGGGGGNFGVITRFCFELTEPPDQYCDFTLQWNAKARGGVARGWVDLCRDADPRLNTFARMSVVEQEFHQEANPAFVVGGRFYGPRDQCEKALKPLVDIADPALYSIRESELHTLQEFRDGLLLGRSEPFLGSDGQPLPAQAYALQVGARSKEAPTETCISDPEPHKVCSIVPVDQPDEVVRVAAAFVDGSPQIPEVNMYLSWHGMGGAGKHDGRGGAYPWRHKDYMLQLQAWWWPGQGVDEAAVLDWVDRFRTAMENAGLVEGAFINFPDRCQPVALYYGHSYGELVEIKRNVDHECKLRFDMGIPTK